jgi:hypothetical protein
MSAIRDPADQLRMRFGDPRDDEKRTADTQRFQQIENLAR